MITNAGSGTNVHEIAAGIYRINTPVSISDGPGRFNFNQYLIADEEPLVFHTGPRKMFAVNDFADRPARALGDGEALALGRHTVRWHDTPHLPHYAHAPASGATLERLAKEKPGTLACMHGSAWRGDGAALLRALASALQARR